MDNFGYEIKTNFQLSNRNVPALLFIPPLEHTARPYARVSGPFFAMRARFSARIPSLRGPRPPAMAQKADASARAKKKREKKISGRYPLKLSKKECAARGKVPVLSSRNLETYESSSTGPFFATRFATRPCVSHVAFVYAKRILFLLCAALNLWIYYGDFGSSFFHFDNFFFKKGHVPFRVLLRWSCWKRTR